MAHKKRHWLVNVLIGLFIFLLLVVIATPYTAKWYINEKLPATLGVDIQVEDVAFDWSSFALSLDNVTVSQFNESPVIHADHIAIDIEAFALLRNQLIVQSLSLDNTEVNVERHGDAHNLARMVMDVMNHFATTETEFVQNAPEEAGGEAWYVDILQIELNRFALTYDDLSDERDQQNLLALEKLELDDLIIDLEANTVSLIHLTLDTVESSIWRDETGIFDVEVLISDVMSEVAEDLENTESVDPETLQPWRITLNELQLSNYRLHFSDLSLERPTAISLGPISFGLSDFSTTTESVSSVALSADTPDGGRVSVEGMMGLSPLVLDLNIQLERFALPTLQSYIDQSTWAEISEGTLDIEGQVVLDFSNLDDPEVAYQGEAAILDFQAIDRRDNSIIAGHKSLTLEQVEFSLRDNHLGAHAVALDDSRLVLSINGDGVFSLLDLARVSRETLRERGEQAKEFGQAFRFSVDELSVTNGLFTFSDHSLSSPFDMDIVIESVDVSGFDTAYGLERASSHLNFGRAGTSIFEYETVDGVITASYYVHGLPMANISGYVAAFTGYEVAGGTFNLDGGFRIADRDLTVENTLLAQRVHVGARIRNEDLMPLPLAVSLMSDLNGDMEIDIPVSGSLDDPSFNVVGLTADLFTQLILRTVTSPLSLLGAIVGRSDLDQVMFVPGQAELSDDTRSRLASLAEALQAKPELALRVTPTSHTVLDSRAISSLLNRVDEGTLSIEQAYELLTERPARELTESLSEVPEADRRAHAIQLIVQRSSTLGDQLSALADARAEAVHDMLVDELGVESEQIQIINPVRTAAPGDNVLIELGIIEL